MEIDPARSKKIKELCNQALELDARERRVFLEQACDSDGDLLREIESLLSHEKSIDIFMAQPAWRYVVNDIAQETESIAGSQLGRYRIHERLGEGGMGEVWRATDQQLKRDVAIKILPPGFSSDAERVRRFQQEAYAISALKHPNIITIHEIGQAGDLHFIVTELVEGETLRTRLSRGPLGWREAVRVAVQIAAGLSAAHVAGIIHRDIKPENVIIQEGGHVKLLDFGIAKWVRAPSAEELRGSSAGVATRMGATPGTLKYMSPEQARGETLDPRTDIFSLGVVFYEMITGRHPYDECEEDILNVLKNEDDAPSVSLRTEAVTVPSSLEVILSRTLRKKRDERYTSAREMSTDLEELKSLIEVSRQEKSQKLFRAQNANQQLNQFAVLYDANRNTRIPLGSLWSIWRFADLKRGNLERETIRKSVLGGLIKIGSLVLVVAIVTLAIAAAKSVNDVWDESVMRDGHTAAVRQAVFSPDGLLLVSVGEDKQVIVWNFARRERLKTLSDHTGWVTSVAFSPDGKLFATASSDETVIVWDAIRLEKVRVLEHPDAVSAVAFSPQGSFLAAAFAGHKSVGTIVWSTGQWNKVWQLPNGSVYGPILFSPTGRMLTIGEGQWDITTGEKLYSHDGWNWAAFSPDSRSMVITDSRGEVSFLNLSRPGEIIGSKLVAHPRGHQDFGRAVVFSPDGKLVASGSENILLWDAATMTKLGRFEYESIVWGLSFSPDGRWLVSTHGDGAVLVWDVAERARVASFNGHIDAVRAVAFSPDGQHVASAGEDRSVILWDAHSGRKIAVLDGHQTRVIGLVFSPDGKWLASSDQAGNLIRWDVEKRKPTWQVKTTSLDNVCLTISPDGRLLAARPGVFDSGTGQKVTDLEHLQHPEGIAFSRDGRRLACVAFGKVLLLETDKWQVIDQQETGASPLVSVGYSPDGRSLVTGGTDGTILLWEVEPLRRVATLGQHAARIKSLVFTTDGATLASAGDDKMIALWDVNRRELIARIGTHTSPVYAIAFSPDGQKLVSGEHDHSVRLYARHRTLWGYRWD